MLIDSLRSEMIWLMTCVQVRDSLLNGAWDPWMSFFCKPELISRKNLLMFKSDQPDNHFGIALSSLSLYAVACPIVLIIEPDFLRAKGAKCNPEKFPNLKIPQWLFHSVFTTMKLMGLFDLPLNSGLI